MAKDQLLALTVDVARLVAAGAPAAREGLHKHAASLRPLADKVAALQPVAEALEWVQQAEGEQAAPAFLDLVTVARQLRAGLSGVGVAGDLLPVAVGGPWQTLGSIRDVYPLREALARTGPKRGPLVQEALARPLPADLRLVGPLLAALEDKNAVLADRVADGAAPVLGAGALPGLRDALDLKGAAADARRLLVLCRLDPVGGAGLCRRALAEGSPRLCVQGFKSLGEIVSAEEIERVALELLDHRNTDVRLLALNTLRNSRGDETLERVLEMAANETGFAPLINAAWQLLWALPHPQTTPRLLRWVGEERAALERLPSEAEAAALTDPARQEAVRRERMQRIAISQRLVDALHRRPDGRGADVVRGMLTLLEGREFQVIRAALLALADALSLSASLEGADRVSGRLEGVRSTDGQGTAACRALVALLDDPDHTVRHASLAALGGVGTVFPEVLQALWAAVRREDRKGGPTFALRALRRLPAALRAPLVPEMLRLVRSKEIDNATWRELILMLPAHLDQERDAILRILRCALQDRDPWTHNTVRMALNGCDPATRQAIEGPSAP
jgi:hypothetical protein